MRISSGIVRFFSKAVLSVFVLALPAQSAEPSARDWILGKSQYEAEWQSHRTLDLAIETKCDGGLKAVWVKTSNDRFSGILIDVTGRASDGLCTDKLLNNY
jgi:hypothetical protein